MKQRLIISDDGLVNVLCTSHHSFLIQFFLFLTFLSQSPHITSSSSSSEGDEDEANGDVGGEPSGQLEELASGKTNSPPPSYNHQQVFQC